MSWDDGDGDILDLFLGGAGGWVWLIIILIVVGILWYF